MRILHNISFLTESSYLAVYKQLMYCFVVFIFCLKYLANFFILDFIT